MTPAGIASAERVCLFAHYHPQDLVAEHVFLYLRALAAAGFRTVVVTTCSLTDDGRARLAGDCDLLIERDNSGHDFGSWIEALRQLPPLTADLLLITNDSVYAPVGDLGAFVGRLLSVPADFYGAVESLEYARHLQSWFLLLRPAAYRSAGFRSVMHRPVDTSLPKVGIIQTYEVGLSTRMYADGLTSHAAFSPLRHASLGRRGGLNASHLLWRELIEDCGIPFLKVQLLRDNPHFIDNLSGWSEVVGRANPALRDAIAADLAVRRSAGGAQRRVRWRDTFSDNNPFTWPELQAFLRRDFRTAGRPLANALNTFGFRVAIRLAKVARRLAGAGDAPPDTQIP